MSDGTERFHPAYFETRFRVAALPASWPGSFVIITACATTGEQWSQEHNASADARLAAELRQADRHPLRITGYSPRTGHAEPGWAVPICVSAGCALGRAFRQDAIYWVEDDALWVVLCAHGERALVGAFRERVDLAPLPRGR